ncbi:MAG: hypothetical protein IKO93_05320, partial [Lentisphaeria bacterium]|nr:hypothetical protein [Lentisphaeria bacterium]
MQTKFEISLDADQYRKQLDSLIQETRQAAAKMADELNIGKNGTGQTTQTISVITKVSDKEDAEKLYRIVQALPKEKIIIVRADVSKTKEIQSLISSLPGGFKRIISSMLGSVGTLSVLTAGFAAGIKFARHFYEQWISGMREASEMSERNAASIAEAAAVNEKYRQSGEAALRELSELSNVEKMSIAQKTEAIALIAKLNKQYGDLGIRIDQVSGKITGLDRAMISKLQKNKDRRLREIDAQIKELSAARDQQDKIISKESAWSRVIQGGTEQTQEALQKREDFSKQIRELMIQRNEIRKTSVVQDYVNRQHAANANTAANTMQRAKELDKRKEQDKYDETKSRSDKIQLLKQRLQHEQSSLKKSKNAAEEAKHDYTISSNPGGKVEAERKSVTAHAEIQTAKENIYSLERQIQKLEKEEAESKKRLSDQAAFELEYNRLIAAGEYDKAAALKLEHELKQQNLKLTEKEKQARLDNQKAQKALNLQISNRDKAQDLKWQMMEKTGQGKEASEQRALYHAEKAKGSKLTDSEIDTTQKLHELSWNMQDLRDQQFGDLSIKTNALTAR